jgi:hypothetical protein
MYARVVTMTLRNSTDQSIIKNFSDSLYFHPMYLPLMEELKSRDGFYQKLHALIDSIDGVKFVSQVVFTSQETLDQYTNEDSVQSLWEYIVQLADDKGINVEMFDTDKYLKF